MSVSTNVPDRTFVAEIAGLVNPTATVLPLYNDQKALINGKEIRIIDNPDEPSPQPIHVSTLQSIVDFYGIAVQDTTSPLIVQISSPSNVQLLAPVVGSRRQQFQYVISKPVLPVIQTDRYLDMETFISQLQFGFLPTEAREELQKQCGSLKAGLLAEMQDDGVTQTVATKAGVTRASTEGVKNEWFLAPFRTFTEIEQPLSRYILRLQQVKNGDSLTAQAGLYEADGGAWRVKAITDIGEWLKARLPEDAVVLA